jgi:hypothetical protein
MFVIWLSKEQFYATCEEYARLLTFESYLKIQFVSHRKHTASLLQTSAVSQSLEN